MKDFQLSYSVVSAGGLIAFFLLNDTNKVHTNLSILCLLLWLSCQFIWVSLPHFKCGSAVGMLAAVIFGLTQSAFFFYLIVLSLLNISTVFNYKKHYLVMGLVSLLFLSGAFVIFRTATDSIIFSLFSILSLLSYGFMNNLHYVAEKSRNDSDQFRSEKDRLSQSYHQRFTNQQIREEALILSEKQRLTNLIHDHLGHQLTGGLIQMEAAKTLYTKDPEKAEQLLQKAIDINRQGIEEIRNMLRSEAAPKETLNIKKLQKELAEFKESYGIDTIFLYGGDLQRLDLTHWQVIAGNLKETLTNTLKYAEATKVDIELKVYHKIIRFTIHNNGKSDPYFHPGLGMLGMEERVAELGGNVLFDGTDGFKVTTILPLDKKHEKSHV
ncbi:histidine kinase [Enterococcus faecalis 13-SD-W-01]|nr:histidine kinase [Enterococcus faecalis 13-SD-W-01]